MTFTVTATGTAPLNYQWQKGGEYAGATAASYTIPNYSYSHAGTYRVVVSNNYGSATSNAANLGILILAVKNGNLQREV